MKLVITDWGTLSDVFGSPERLEQYGEVIAYDTTAPEELARHVGNAEILLCNKTAVTAAELVKCQGLRYIGVCATGYNNIDLDAAKIQGITVCNAGAYSTQAVAQHTFALILHQYNHVAQYDAAVREGAWMRAKTFSISLFQTRELFGKTLAVIGYGSIGRCVAQIGVAFGMEVIVSTRTMPTDCPYPVVSLDEAFRRADVLTLHTPLTSQTAQMVNRQRLCAMKPTAILVNTARGGLIDEDALAWALKDGAIASAALDVLTQEPMGDTPLQNLPNCTITPHVAWDAQETRERLFAIVEKNLRCFLAGAPQNVVTAPNALKEK